MRPLAPVPDQPAPDLRADPGTARQDDPGRLQDHDPGGVRGGALLRPERAESRVPTRRDALGFVTDAVPHITAAQLRWLTYRLESGSNAEACTLSETDPLTVLQWMAEDGFRATYEASLENKREGFKTLTAHLLPAVIRSLQEMLDSKTMKDRKEAATLLLRAQGLLVDKTSLVSPDAVHALFSLLREERPIEARVIDMTTHRSLLPGEE